MRPARIALALLLTGCFPDADKLRAPANPGNGGSGGGGGGGSGGTGGTTGVDAGTGGAGGGGQMDGGGQMQSRVQACAEMANALAAQLGRCNPYLLMAVYGSQAAYAARLQLNCNIFDAPGVNWPARPFAPCAAAMAAQNCADWRDDLPLAACPLSGQFVDGEPCGSGFQCQSGLCSLPSTGCGRCIKRPTLGQTCDEACAEGLACNPNKVCVMMGRLGAPCDANSPCRLSLACRSGACAQRATVGPCIVDDECDFAQGYTCNPDRGQCVKISFGSTCSTNPDGTYVYCTGLVCKAGMCIPRVDDGGMCSDANRLFCKWPARCLNAQCRLPAPDRTCAPSAVAGDPLPTLQSGVAPRISDARAFLRPEGLKRP
jgi:hypothetical protein